MLVIFTEEEQRAIIELLKQDAVKNMMGSEEWDLTEEQEEVLWLAIEKAEGL